MLRNSKGMDRHSYNVQENTFDSKLRSSSSNKLFLIPDCRNAWMWTLKTNGWLKTKWRQQNSHKQSLWSYSITHRHEQTRTNTYTRTNTNTHEHTRTHTNTHEQTRTNQLLNHSMQKLQTMHAIQKKRSSEWFKASALTQEHNYKPNATHNTLKTHMMKPGSGPEGGLS